MMSKKRPNSTPTNTKNSRALATTHCISPTSPQKPAHLGPDARQEWDRLVAERQGQPRTMSQYDEWLFLFAAATAYSYGVKIRQLAHQLGAPVPDIPYQEWKKGYAALCEALGCMPADPMLRDS